MPCPPPSSVANWSERDESFTEDARLRMAYAWLLNNRPVDVFAPGLADTSRADLLLLRGEYEEAATAYDHDIRSTPHLAEAWAGLAVASRGKADQAAATLRQRPELVRAVYARLAVASGTISPLDIARGIARSSIKPNE
jgi:tetratricopeptide (TPR) repeat protein